MNASIDINSSIFPEDIKKLSTTEKYSLAGDIREKILNTVSENGGHLASNLGSVEMTIALHSVFDAPADKIIFDVGHQSYAHKILTGRGASFDALRKKGGISGFTRINESPYDVVCSGHASSSISAALGIARARDIRGESYNVVAVLGDGALSGGMCYEALNDAGQTHTKLIIVLNDNEMSINRNVGAMSKHLTRMRQSSLYRNFKQRVRRLITHLPSGGDRAHRFLSRIKEAVKALLVNDMFFDSLGIEYLGPIDGHDIDEMQRAFENAKAYTEPVVLHVVTQKGKGYVPAREHPEKFHGIDAFDIKTGDKKHAKLKTAGEYACEALEALAKKDERICCISAAMLPGTGLSGFNSKFPGRCFDTGITEEHAATMAAGLALGGQKPYLALYSTFLQRAYDQINIDVCLNNAPVTLLIDRSGLNGSDGETHQGVYDIQLLSSLPGLTLCAPKDTAELKEMIGLSSKAETPWAIRYPKILKQEEECGEIKIGKWEHTTKTCDICVLAYGRMYEVAENVRKKLSECGRSIDLINCRFLKPMDTEMLKTVLDEYTYVFITEDNVYSGGLADGVIRFANEIGSRAKLFSRCVPDEYIPAATVSEQLCLCGLDEDSLAEFIKAKTAEKNDTEL